MGVLSLYKMTELYWLQDQSKGQRDTWAFLNRRVAELSAVQSVVSGSTPVGETFVSAASTAIETVRILFTLNLKFISVILKVRNIVGGIARR